MGCPPLHDANRRLLDAIEVPPDSGLEDRLDRIAATLWALSGEGGAGPDPDPGTVCRLREKLRALERRAGDRRAAEIARARRAVDACGETLEEV